tara:strand:+ start:586 stop:945 length:360 start_codon:yes stop_codon:yes gene_type:complete
MEIDKKIIVKLLETLEELKKSVKDIGDIKSDKTIKQKDEFLDNKIIKSPIVGTAYLAPEPGAKKFITEGQKIKKGETIMIVEAMKTMNHVPSSFDGTILKVCVDDGEPVEFGQNLVILK